MGTKSWVCGLVLASAAWTLSACGGDDASSPPPSGSTAGASGSNGDAGSTAGGKGGTSGIAGSSAGDGGASSAGKGGSSGTGGKGGSGEAGSAGSGDAGAAGSAGSGDAGAAGSAGSGDAGAAGSGDAGAAGSAGSGDAGAAGSAGSGDAGAAGSGDAGAAGAGDAGAAGSGDAGAAGAAGGSLNNVGKPVVLGATTGFTGAYAGVRYTASRTQVTWSAQVSSIKPEFAAYVLDLATLKVTTVPTPNPVSTTFSDPESEADVFVATFKSTGFNTYDGLLETHTAGDAATGLFDKVPVPAGYGLDIALSPTTICGISNVIKCFDRTTKAPTDGPYTGDTAAGQGVVTSKSVFWVNGNGTLRRWVIGSDTVSSALSSVRLVHAYGDEVWALTTDGHLFLIKEGVLGASEITPTIPAGTGVFDFVVREHDAFFATFNDNAGTTTILRVTDTGAVNDTTRPLCSNVRAFVKSGEALVWLCSGNVYRAPLE